MSGCVIDDPMLALIARFAGCCENLHVSEETFLRGQLEQIRAYVDRYPPDQRQARAMEWIARNAEYYRRSWQRELVADEAPTSRCPDCPLQRRKPGAIRCEIHGRWLRLLNRYVAGETSSREYVEDSLKLLRRHKERLRASITRARTATPGNNTPSQARVPL